MLKNDLYHIVSIRQQENTVLAILQLNKLHQIFTGHFPGQPVLPGACILNMVQEVLTSALHQSYQLKKANSLKFIAPIDPDVTAEIEFKLICKTVEGGMQVTGGLSANNVICFKIQAEYRAL